ncbi:TVP38/TMEM64 family protein [Dyella tabacisoli]|uniref:TVP38/TMEM64 family membrane protein n=1 Tax=Dyella tabacisoli TaxID=2282381 RepID=A0A369UJG0_9GAMM|nr:VTT domain-containing protein [Dyella tabacisoli]RDD80483.1 DedA family protein [Dyella tabacisoli]
MSRFRAALPLILLLLAGIALFASGALDQLHPEQLIAHQDQLHAQIHSNPWLSRLAFVGLLTLAMSTGIPGTVVIIFAGGFAFGVVEGTLCSSIGVTLGSLILYLASRYAMGGGGKHPPVYVERLRHGFAKHPVSYTLFLRFVPVVPFGMVTLSLAWLRCPLWLFIGATWLGGTVMLIFETSVGAGLGTVLSHNKQLGPGLLLQYEVLLPLGALALLALLPLLLSRFTRRFHHHAPPPTE